MPLLGIERNTAECQTAAMKMIYSNVPELDFFMQEFQHKLRLPVLDRFSANFRGERMLKKQGVVTNAYPCDVHKVAGSANKGFDVASNTISGLVNVALTHEGAGSTHMLRSLLQQIFMEELEIIFDDPPQGEILRHRKSIYEACIPICDEDGSESATKTPFKMKSRKRRFVLSHLANSDLCAPEIRHYCCYGCCRDPTQTMELFQTVVTDALIPCKMEVINRKSWTGYSGAVSWATLLGMHWNLFSRIMIKFCGSPGSYAIGDGTDEKEDEHETDEKSKNPESTDQPPPLLETWLWSNRCNVN